MLVGGRAQNHPNCGLQFVIVIFPDYTHLLLFVQIISHKPLDRFSEIKDTVDIDVKLYKKVSKFKMLDSKAGPWACPKPPKYCLDYFSLTAGRIVHTFFI